MPQISPTLFEDLLVDALPLPACICEAPSGLIIRSNAQAVALWGQRPEPDTRIHDLLHFIRPDGAPLQPEAAPLVAAVAAGVAEADRQAVIARRGQPSVRVSINILPLNTTGQRRAGLMLFHSLTEPQVRPGLPLTERDRTLESQRFEWHNGNSVITDRRAAVEQAANKVVPADCERSAAVARMTRFINNLLDAAGIDAGKLAIEPEPIDVGRLVNHVVEAFAPIAAAKNITLNAILPVPPLHAALDDGRILQVLANLVSNAIKFTPAGGGVSIRIRPTAKRVQFAVSDTGIGIPGSRLADVFERFRQAGPGHRGPGLGLHISKRIVEAHSGRIWAQSEVAVGSTFYVELPIAAVNR